MKNFSDFLLNKESISEIVMGNTAIVRAMVESGTRVVTSYPGSPTPEIATAIKSMNKDERPFYFEFSTNEKVATEVAYGATINGHLSCVFYKSVGLNVAADTFVQLGLMNLIGGMIVVLGDDPGANSSQNEQDNRHLAHLSYIPVFEPSSPQEVYEMYLEAAELSIKNQMPVILRLTTHVCHQKQKVQFGEWNNPEFDPKPRFDVKNGPYIPITKKVFPMKKNALNKLVEIKKYSENSKFNEYYDNNNKDKGVITCGLPVLSLLDILPEAKVKPDVLKLGMPYPLAENQIIKFLKEHRVVKILEELDPIMEKDIKILAFDNKIDVEIIGKQDFGDWIGEYTPDKVTEIMNKVWPEDFKKPVKLEIEKPLPPRPPQMCPGCGHRSAFYAIKQAFKTTDISVGDIGCHTLGFLPPYEMGQLLMSMGASSGLAAGLRLFNTERKVVAFIGDSTFFHAGSAGILNAIFNKHDFTLIVMENGTTAMTGHQNHPGTGKNFDEISEAISIKQVLEGYGVNVREVDTYNQKKLTELVKEASEEEGFNVVIARHNCMLKQNRENKRKSGYKLRQVDINQEKCDQKYACVSDFACPTFNYEKETGKISVNPDLCIGDGSCLQTCPSKAVTPPKIVEEEGGQS